MRVFVSYAAGEISVAQAIQHALRGSDIHAWLDVDGVHIGQAHRSRILEAIAASQAMIFLLSHRSVYRPWVQAELHEAARRGIPVVVVRLIACAIPPWVTPTCVIDRGDGAHDEADEALVMHLKRMAQRVGATRRV